MNKPSGQDEKTGAPLWIPSRATALKIAISYAVVAGLWISLSGWILHLFVQDPKYEAFLEISKGWIFVVVTATILGVALLRYFNAIRSSAQKLGESESRLRLALDATQMGIFEWNMQQNHLNWSEWHEKIWGYQPGQFDHTFESFEKRVHPKDRNAIRTALQTCSQNHQKYKMEFRIIWPDDSIHWISALGEFFYDSQGTPTQMRGIVMEITQRKQTEQLQALSAEILNILNDPHALQDATQRILTAIKQVTELDAVGIRLRQGKDFPYFAASGFSKCFLELESSLLSRGTNGEFCRDKQGEICLECTCGMVISGHTNPSNPLFTSGGSAWTNNSVLVAKTPREQDPRLNPRNRCVHEGYQSIALIPIRMNEKIIGLLQLNDHRKDRFTVEMIRFFEGIASSFGVAMHRLQQEQAVRENESNLRSLVNAIPESLALVEPDGRIVAANSTFAQRWNIPGDSFNGKSMFDFIPPEQAEQRKIWNDEVFRTRKTLVIEHERNHRIYRASVCPVFEPNGQVHRVVGFSVDVTEQRAAENALRASEAQFRNTLDNMMEGCQIIAPDWTYLYLNEAAYRHARRSPNTLLGKKFTEEWPDIEKSPVYIAIKDCLKNGTTHRMENEFNFTDGSVGCFELSIQPVPQGVFILSIDITERKHTESERRKWADAFENCAHGIGIGSPETNTIVICNPALARMLGKTVQEVTGSPVLSIYDPEDHERIKKWLAQAEREGQIRFQTRMIRSDGTLFPVQMDIVIVRGENGKTQYRVATAQDVTDRLAAEHALQASEERFRILVENAPDGIFVQAMSKFVFINNSAARILGATNPEDMIGRSVMNHIHPEDQALVAERMRILNVEHRSLPIMVGRLLRLDGSVFDAELSAVAIVFEGISSSLTFFQDITERKRLESQFRQVQKLEAIGQLAGGVAHDFNNILSATMMHLSMLQMSSSLDDETRRTLSEIEKEAERAATLTRQLLMFSRRSVLTVKPLDLNDVIGNLLKMLTRLIGEHIDLRFDRKSRLPKVQADAGMMEQVLMNLVVNARDAMPKGGRISIGVSDLYFDANAAQEHPARRAGFFVCLAVSDTGCGMTPEIMKQIFDPFFTTKEVGKGTGLGLATVHGIAAQHKGWVEVESEVGFGSTFRVYFPAMETDVIDQSEENDRQPIPHGRETILMVEDDAEVRQMISKVLRSLGYQVYEAANGLEAITLWEIHGSQFDLLLTDMVMPEGLTGLELVERLQDIKPELKAIISSGYSDEMVQAGVPQKKGLTYLPKPYEVDVLAAVVRKSLDQTD